MLNRKQARVCRALFDEIDRLEGTLECKCGAEVNYCQACGEVLPTPKIEYAREVEDALDVPTLDSEFQDVPETDYGIANALFKRDPHMLSLAALEAVIRNDPDRVIAALERVAGE